MNARLRIRDCRVPLVVAITLLVSACAGSDTPQARFDDYLTRLARTLDVERPAAADTTARLYPARRELLLPVQQPRTGWIGFFELRRCALANLVAHATVFSDAWPRRTFVWPTNRACWPV